jgi:hypothetical protein
MPTQVRHHPHAMNASREVMPVLQCGICLEVCLHLACIESCGVSCPVLLCMQAAPLPTASWSWRWSSGTAASSGACQR